MEIRQLRYFIQIVESGSLSKASELLHVAQPALSQQLAKLEEEIGKPLLIRSARGVQPTENGLALYQHARFIMRQFDQTLSIARSDAGAVHGMVTIGLPATTVAAIGLALVKRIRERYPKVLINVVEGMSGHIGHLMRLGQLDLAVLFRDDVARDLRVEPLFIEELFVIVADHSGLIPAHVKAVTIEDVSEMPLILPTSSHGLRQRIEAEFENRGLSTKVVAEIDSLSLLMNCVYDDMGATIKPMGAVMLEGLRGRKWRALPVSNARFRRRNFLYSLPTERLTTAAAVVAGELKEAVAELVADGSWQGFEAVEDRGGSSRGRSPALAAE